MTIIYKILLDEKEKKEERDGMQSEYGKWQKCQQLLAGTSSVTSSQLNSEGTF
jgi:hypothetical protein